MSEESLPLVTLFLDLFRNESGYVKLAKPSSVSESSWIYFLEYAVQILNNLGNFKSFGDTKFIPRLPVEDFETIVSLVGSVKAKKILSETKEAIYSALPASTLLLGYPGQGFTSGYYSSNVTKDDVEFVQSFLEDHHISALNTRLFKEEGVYKVLIASAQITKAPTTFTHKNKTIIVQYGDFAQEMAQVAFNLEKAGQYAANDNQKKMMAAYVDSFLTGSIESHKDSQRHWIRDIGPIVESNIGFIETYRDPSGVRAEWEGFVAVVNKEMTKKFGALVDAAPHFIDMLPWGKDFEKDKFLKPDFTSLEVVSFATSGSPPSGINIPNYDDIRQTEGFKNVSLGNIVSAKAANEKVTFLLPQDVAVYESYRGRAFEVQVGLHELLGHGSGKLLAETAPGVYNFDINSPPISPLTNAPIKTWYKSDETWGSLFKSIAASYEECRAEAVATFLCVNQQVLNIFGYTSEQEMSDITYICYLNMARSGLLALEFYDPASRKWGQAHVQARYALLQVMIESGLVQIREEGEDGLVIVLDRSQILTKGVPAVGSFLQKLNIYKSTGDAVGGTEFYVNATTVPDSWLKYRDLVLQHLQPRKVFVQPNTILDGDRILLRDYKLTYDGFIKSFVERL